MGQSHYKSNYIGFNGTEYIASMAALKTVATDSAYIKLGASQYLLVGNSNTEASVLAEATSLVGATIQGSMYMSRKGNMWFMVSDTAASPVQLLA